jgi:hypothetical protein
LLGGSCQRYVGTPGTRFTPGFAADALAFAVELALAGEAAFLL